MELSFLAWTEEYAVGHKGLDAEHRQLAEAVNEICCTEHAEHTQDQLRPLLNALVFATVEHFKHENSVMREFSLCATPSQKNHPVFHKAMSVAAINEHCAEHAQALLGLETIIRAFCSGTDSGQETLGQKLIDWFTEHAINHDGDLKGVFQDYFANAKGLKKSC